MKFDLDYIEKVVNLLESSTLTELELKDGAQSITMKRGCTGEAAVVPKAPSVKKVEESLTEEAAPEAETKRKSIVSPMVGTFYKSMSPEAKPFVEVGQTVATGQVVCIIEAMKLMNEIEAEVSGRIVEICVEDGQPVEFGQVLMYLEQALGVKERLWKEF